jgi:serine phosphatase RsbU (regulator of sigma subunit)
VLDDRRTAAATLQRALLTPLPTHPGVTMAARYVPAHHEDQVGGDWYDAIRVDERRLALAIGDVTGHDIDAAAAMSEYRSMLRVLTVDRQEQPSGVLRRLEHAARLLGTARLASVLLAYLDPAPGGHTLTWSNAGHPAAILGLPGGPVAPLPAGRQDPLIGAVRHTPRGNLTIHLPPGSLLLLHTDGLVEDRRVSIDVGTARVLDMVAAQADQDVDTLADLLISDTGAAREDDAALLVIRTGDG